MRVTLRDVARQVGVHPSTVSRVLNPATRHAVSADLARRISETAESLGYRPNLFAYTLKTKRSLSVGVMIPDLMNPVFPPMVRGIEEVLEAAGYTLILANTDNNVEREGAILEKMRGRMVDGMILSNVYRDDSRIDQYAALEVPVVLINRVAERDALSSVVADNLLGASLAVNHLADLGHTRIAHLGGPQSLSTAHRRHQGYLHALNARSLTADPELYVSASANSVAEGRRTLLLLLDRGQPFTAVVCSNDLLAVGACQALEERGLRCPADVSVTGYNDVLLMDRLQPPLTTVRMPMMEMGRRAASILLERMRNPEASPQRITLPVELIVRGSTAPPPGR
jgi:LacI family transcriptional regulator